VPRFRYRAIDQAGAMVEGEIEAGAEALAIQRLQAAGLLPLDATPAREVSARRGKRLKGAALTAFTRELAILLGAGQPLEQALLTLADKSAGGALPDLAQAVLDLVRGGASLSAALEAQGTTFPPIYVNMVRAGESAGSLAVVLERLADLRERAEKVRETIVSAMIYPLILVGVSVVSLYLLLTLVVPHFEVIFRDSGAALPRATAVIIAIGHAAEDYGLVFFLGLFGAVLAGRQALTLDGPRLAFDRLLLRLPLIGSLNVYLLTARFCRTLSTLVENGVDLPAALALARNVVVNRHAAAALDQVITQVRQGRGLAAPLAQSALLPAIAVQLLKVGEETGRIAGTAAHVADAYERKLEITIKRLLALLEPALIIVLGLAVGGIVMSIMLAVVSVNDLAI
jgi:general secretion pathway protein F